MRKLILLAIICAMVIHFIASVSTATSDIVHAAQAKQHTALNAE